MKKLFMILMTLLTIGCAEQSNKLSQHVDGIWSEQLKELGISGFYLSSNMRLGELGVCDSEYTLFGHCLDVTTINIDWDLKHDIAGLKGWLTEEGWVVKVPHSSKGYSEPTIQRTMDRAIRSLLTVKKYDAEIGETWNES